VIIANKLACQLYLGDSICIVRMFLFLGVLFIAEPLIAAENLLIVDVYARILPEGQIEPIPDPFIELIVSGKQGPLPSGVQQLQGKTFQIQSASRDFQAVIPAWTVRESNSLLLRQSCRMAAVRSQISAGSRIRVLRRERAAIKFIANNEPRRVHGCAWAENSTIGVSQVESSLGGGLLLYYLIFSAAKGVIE
jgi:hypothetical protein